MVGLIRVLSRCGAVALVAAAGCTSGAPAVCGAPTAASVATTALATGNTEFAAAFFAPAAAAAGAEGNLVFSPYSVSATLTMVDGGAVGDTARQIQSVLHLPGTAAAIAPAYATLACANETDGTSQGNQLSFANSVWAQQGMSFEHAFVSLLANGYAAPLKQVDFGNASAAMGTIDQWVSSHTQGKIPTLLQAGDVDASTRLVLVNAVYFAGAWDSGFDASQTAQQTFTLSNGERVEVATMNGSIKAGGNTIQMRDNGAWITTLELPYKGGGLAMDILMPSGSLSEFEASLTAETLSAAIDSAASHPRQMQVALPKWSFGTRIALAPVLAAMGMKNVFDPQTADLSGMDGRRDLYVNRVVQQAFIRVDEQGTVAAAATASSVTTTAYVAPTSINQPFLFVLRDTTNGSILFFGHVEDPRKSA